eukprot:40755-Alexandrium_andersonii.AAC.1
MYAFLLGRCWQIGVAGAAAWLELAVGLVVAFGVDVVAEVCGRDVLSGRVRVSALVRTFQT